MAFIGLPWLQMIAGGKQMKSTVCCLITEFDQLRDWKLLVREHVADESFADATIGLALLVALRTSRHGRGGGLCDGHAKRRCRCHHSGEFKQIAPTWIISGCK
jgi:hypothetical protein